MSLLSASKLGMRDPEDWRRRVNFFQNKKVHASYDKGAELVKKFLFEGELSV
ncbi:MAG: hypothetical protein RDA78_22710 [Roseibium sp.]|uniref:hypothetical protein n=1 Tax=Roseibium sp. TaxID=1936156 RepID=UPI003D9C44E8